MIKVPPHSFEAEQSVLWSLLIDKDGFFLIGDLLGVEDFYEEGHAFIYEAMRDLYKLNKPIDLITVKEKLTDKNRLDKVGGITYLTELVDVVPTSSNIYEYGTIVKNKAVLRRLIKAWNDIIAQGYMEDKMIGELLEKGKSGSLFPFLKPLKMPNRIIIKKTGRFPVQAFLNAIPDADFIRTLESISRGVGATFNDADCSFPGDLDPSDDIFEGVCFGLLNEEIVISNQEFAIYLKQAASWYLLQHPQDTQTVVALLRIYEGRPDFDIESTRWPRKHL